MEKALIKQLFINYLKLLTVIKLRLRFRGKIIGLAGCFGKSSAIDLLETVFKQEHKVFSTNQSGKGLNSETGVPFAILGVHAKGYSPSDWIKYFFHAFFGVFKKLDYDFLILELGVDKPKDMKFLTSFIKPNVGILINSNNTHSANFEDLQAKTKRSFEDLISEENGYVFQAARDAIVYNLDDPEVVKQITRFNGKDKIPFSSSNSPLISEFKVSLDGTYIKFKYLNEDYEFSNDLVLLEEYKGSIEMLLRTAGFYHLKPESILNGLKEYKLPPGRCSLFKGVNNSFILDSSYNSSFLPAASAIKLVKNISQGRKIAVLGDMRELGVLSEKEHRKLAEIALDNLDLVITVGPMMKEYFMDEFNNRRWPHQKIYSFESTKRALDFISKNNFEFVKPNDLILVKGSQNTLLLEIIVEELLANEEDVSKLCRRGSFYEDQRIKLLKS